MDLRPNIVLGRGAGADGSCWSSALGAEPRPGLVWAAALLGGLPLACRARPLTDANTKLLVISPTALWRWRYVTAAADGTEDRKCLR